MPSFLSISRLHITVILIDSFARVKAAKPKITQKELIARLQVLGMMIDQSSLLKIENGQIPITEKEVIALTKALKVLPISLLQEPED